MTASGRVVLEAVGLSKTYPGEPPITALSDVNFSVAAGDKVAVVGPSGAGKSTLLNLIGLLDSPSAGYLILSGLAVNSLRERERDRLRARDIGFVFQESHVLGHRTVQENLEIALVARAVPACNRPALIESVLDQVGLTERTHALGRLLSGGERQRLALARAIITPPRFILADEPTGNLDPDNADRILTLLDRQASLGVAVIVITHDPRVASWASTVRRLVPGGSFDRSSVEFTK